MRFLEDVCPPFAVYLLVKNPQTCYTNNTAVFLDSPDT